MLPRRCAKCRCYVAPQLKQCPRCGKTASAVVGKPTKEEKLAARMKLDEQVTTISGKNIYWIPSAYSLRVHEAKLKELDRLLERADGARERNAIRCEIRITKAHLARKRVPPGKKGWTTEHLAARHAYITIFISPKQHRYVLADRDSPADLLIVPATRKSRIGMPVMRLQRFEKSSHMKLIKRQEKEAKEHTTRRKVKKVHRAKKRMMKRHAE